MKITIKILNKGIERELSFDENPDFEGEWMMSIDGTNIGILWANDVRKINNIINSD